MEKTDLRLVTSRESDPVPPPRPLIGRQLVDSGAVSPDCLVRALHLQQTQKAPLGEILVAEGWARPEDIRTALAEQFGLPPADFARRRPDLGLCARKPPGYWLRHAALPWRRMGQQVLVATARPDRFDELRTELVDVLGPIVPVLSTESDIAQAVAAVFRPDLAEAASTRVAPEFSCRVRPLSLRLVAPLALGLPLAGFVIAPRLSFAVLTLLAVVFLALFAGLKLAALVNDLAHGDPLGEPTDRSPQELPRPRVSVLVPLFREREIAGALIDRLQRLTYSKALLEVILVLEEHDEVTCAALHAARLPAWMRVIVVPQHGGLTTKPRAMNYALDFCRGEIIGVWDAEDAPACDQIERVVAHFAEAPPDVVCLQGVLDFYNPRTNWLARCFTIEYAAWFRIILPGLARMGLVVPLGGTTLFFRRDKLEELGGWDAHNVTEDADLGMRLCRAGYRTEMIGTVTYEEANCRAWPWIKQRSRWLKGFLVTYLVHMRAPVRLARELGARRFLSFQAFFLGTLSQFLLAPVLWSFWLVMLGLPHPAEALLPHAAVLAFAAFFVTMELMAITIGVLACRRAERSYLMPFVPTMLVYFPLGTVAAYKALGELVIAPYYWDKTQHGIEPAESEAG